MDVEVPAAFTAIGYSGFFAKEASMDMSAEEVEEWRERVPCLLGNTGWLALQVVDEQTMLVVRRDCNAIVDALTQSAVRV
jgi:hypothetical protein